MSLEIRLNNRHSQVELLSRDQNRIRISVDDKTYEVDVVRVEKGIYSILLEDRSYMVELIEGESPKLFSALTAYRSFDLEIIDAETRYMLSRKGDEPVEAGNQVSSPMPGKVVKIPVKVGDKVESGETVIIVSAMKMESEYKAAHEGLIKEIHVAEGDTIEGHQPLITIE
jgi:biotin carboxyl carrier protein